MKKQIKFCLAVLSGIALLASCGGTPSEAVSSSAPVSMGPTTLNTNQTDKLKLKPGWENKKFTEDGIGKVELNFCTDGDTTSVIAENKKISIRYIGIDTPESTSNIDPWGHAASVFNKSKLMNANAIVAENFIDLYGQKTSSRWLAYIWYQPKPGDDFRNLNLEMVEQAYTANSVFKKEDPYFEYFQAAELNAKNSGKRIWGEKDPDYDYSKTVNEITIYELKKNWENYASTSKQLRIQATVVDKIGGQMVLRDYKPHQEIDEETGEIISTSYSGIYSYTVTPGSTSWIKIGDVIKLYCKAGEFNGNKQLTDLKLDDSPLFSQYYCEVIDHVNNIEPTLLTSADQFEALEGDYVETTVEVTRTLKAEDKNDPVTGEFTGNFTVRANLEGTSTYLNLRINKDCNPTYDDSVFVEGNKLKVKGQLTKYYDNYQIVLGNNIAGANKLTIVE